MTDDQATHDRIAANPRPTLTGDAAAMQEVLSAYAEAGVDEFIVPDWSLGTSLEEKSDSIDRFMTDVAAPFH